MRDVLEHAHYIAKKDLKEYYMKPGTISWGVLFPITFAIRDPSQTTTVFNIVRFPHDLPIGSDHTD